MISRDRAATADVLQRLALVGNQRAELLPAGFRVLLEVHLAEREMVSAAGLDRDALLPRVEQLNQLGRGGLYNDTGNQRAHKYRRNRQVA